MSLLSVNFTSMEILLCSYRHKNIKTFNLKVSINEVIKTVHGHTCAITVTSITGWTTDMAHAQLPLEITSSPTGQYEIYINAL